jgi:hypothetical protein
VEISTCERPTFTVSAFAICGTSDDTAKSPRAKQEALRFLESCTQSGMLFVIFNFRENTI